MLLTIRISWRRQVNNQVLHLFIVHHSDVVFDELQSLNSLNEMLLVQILLVIRVIVILLRNFCHELVQGIARSIFAVHQHWVSLCGFDANLSIIIIVV